MVLLIQFRTEQSGPHDLKCIWESTGLPYSEFRMLNLFNKSVTDDVLKQEAEKANKIIISGSAETGYEEKDPRKKKEIKRVVDMLRPVIKKVVKEDKPLLAICFGANVLADIMGGTVVVDKELAEAGVVDMHINEAGMKDDLFDGFKSPFRVISGHKASIKMLPKDAVLLASSDVTPIHAFRFGKNVYGTQFHAELNFDDLMARLELYPEYKEAESGSLDREKIDVKKIIRNFIEK